MTLTIDIPGTVSAWNHAGSGGGIVGDGVSVLDDTGYVYFVNGPGGVGSGGSGSGYITYGYGLFISFPAYVVPGVVLTTDLVVRSAGPDASVIAAAYWIEQGVDPNQHGITVLSVRRDATEYTTPPNYGYEGEGYWTAWRTQSATATDYTTDVLPLKWVAGDTFDGVTSHPFTDPTSTVEFVRQSDIELGHVEYNPGSGLYLDSLYAGDHAAPTVAGSDLRFSYIALRITYVPYPLTAAPKDLRRRFVRV